MPSAPLQEGVKELLVNIISQDRLGRYLIAAGHDVDRALALYGWNIQLSEAFFPVLSAAEVCLRNTVAARLESLYGATWWDNATLHGQIRRNGKRIVLTARDKLALSGQVTSGRMTAELNFGFWVNMLLPRHETAVWTDLRASFTHLPANVTYGDLYSRCDAVREFRNRIFHHEPILHRDISNEHSMIMELIGWLSPDKAAWIKPYSRVMSVMRTKP